MDSTTMIRAYLEGIQASNGIQILQAVSSHLKPRSTQLEHPETPEQFDDRHHRLKSGVDGAPYVEAFQSWGAPKVQHSQHSSQISCAACTDERNHESVRPG